VHTFVRWKDNLTDAQTVKDVVRVMRDYLATLSLEDRKRFPPACRDALSVDDIADSALVLFRAEVQFTGDPVITAMLHEVAQTFVAASNRIVAIQARGQPLSGSE
jgi:hypothetical protein